MTELFEFTSHRDWELHASARFANHGVSSGNTVCLDAKQRECWTGREFKRAHDQGTYPVKVFAKEGGPK